jgi:hypothetical protein
MSEQRCPGCGAAYQPIDGPPSHPYIGASAACWSAFGGLLAREFGDVAYGRVHRHSVDAYAAQHPGSDGRRERQSVALHLVAIAQWLDGGITTPQLNRITQDLAAARRDWPWLEPPDPTGYRMTVLDVLRASSGEEHTALVRAWAEAVWDAWAPHHDVVRGWAAEAICSSARVRLPVASKYNPA